MDETDAGKGGKEHMPDINKNYTPEEDLGKWGDTLINIYSFLKKKSENVIFLEKWLKIKMEIVKKDISR